MTPHAPRARADMQTVAYGAGGTEVLAPSPHANTVELAAGVSPSKQPRKRSATKSQAWTLEEEDKLRQLVANKDLTWTQRAGDSPPDPARTTFMPQHRRRPPPWHVWLRCCLATAAAAR